MDNKGMSKGWLVTFFILSIVMFLFGIKSFMVNIFSMKLMGSATIIFSIAFLGATIVGIKELMNTNKQEVIEESTENARVQEMANAIFNDMIVDNSKKTVPATIDDYELMYQYDRVAIVGTQYYDFDEIDLGEELYCIAEPENEYDNRAVAVYNSYDQKIGHLPNSKLKDIVFDYLHKKELPVYAVLQEVDEENEKYFAWIGLYGV